MCLLQLIVGVFDSQLSHMVTYGQLNISMIRNPSAPIFNPDQYRFETEWRFLPGGILGQIFASDNDGVSYCPVSIHMISV